MIGLPQSFSMMKHFMAPSLVAKIEQKLDAAEQAKQSNDMMRSEAIMNEVRKDVSEHKKEEVEKQKSAGQSQYLDKMSNQISVQEQIEALKAQAALIEWKWDEF